MQIDLFHLTHTEVPCFSCAHVSDSGPRKVLKEGESVPEIFEDPIVKRASHWVLSTSALSSKYLREYSWGEVRLTCPFFCECVTFIAVDELLFKWCQMALALRI